jgi:ABC-type multidrug transport system fused ATPase/permease subunit
MVSNVVILQTMLLSGSASVQGSVAYVPQQVWILGATVRDNILFECSYDEDWYRTVLTACSLWEDLQIFEEKDRTMVGEKGVTLSGGQKQRISLARAVYSKREIIVLDDPLSALDAHTGRHVFKHLLGHNGLLKDSIVLFVTHAAQYLSQVNEVLVVYDGTVAFKGPYSELMATATSDEPVDASASVLRSILVSFPAKKNEKQRKKNGVKKRRKRTEKKRDN